MADMSRKAAVVLRVDLDASGIKQRAEEISKKIKEALERNKDTQDPRIAALLKDLKTLDHSLDITKKSLSRLSIDPKTGQSLSQVTARVNESREAALAAKKAYDDYVKSLESTKRGSQVMANIRTIGSEDTKAKYFGANADKRKMVEQFQVLNEEVTRTRFALKAAQEEWNKFDSRAATSENGIAKALTRDSEAGGVLLLRLNELEKKYEDTGKTASKSSSSFRSGFYFARTIINDINRNLSKLCDRMKQFAKSVLSAAKNMLHLRKESHKASTTMSDGIKHALRNIMRYGLGVRSLYFLFRRLRTYAKEALGEMAKAFPEVNAQMSRAVTALNHMKGALGTAIQPLLTVLVPVLEKVAALITKILNLIGSVFALLTGQKSIYSAVAVQTDYAASLEKTGSAAKKAKKELEGYLSPIDEINKYQSKRNDEDSSDSGADSGGLKFVEQPISAFAQKIKDILDKIMAPIKKAWANVGDFVKDSWMHAFESVKNLVKDIGRDFLEVWNQPATVAMLENILRIVGNIGLFIGNLADSFDEAWNKADVGKRILEKIRDICAIIAEHVESITASWAEWAEEVDFTPLLEQIDSWLESLKEPIDFLMGVFEDFNKDFLQPLAKWAVEDGSKQLLQVFEDFNNKVDWEGLRSKFDELWKHLEPFAERLGEGLIMFLDKLAQGIADFMNSEGFDNLIDFLNALMDSISAEDVYNILSAVAKILPIVALGILALSSAFSSLSSVLPIIGIVLKAIEFFGTEIGATVAGVIGTIAKIASGVGLVIGGLVLAVKNFIDMWKDGWDVIKTILEAIGLALAAVGAIILGVSAWWAALIAAIIFVISQIVIVVHDNWDVIKQFFIDLWDSIVEIWNKVADWFSTYVIEPLAILWEGFSSRVKKIFEGLWIIIKAVWLIVASWFNQNVIQPLVNFFAPIVEKISKFFQVLWSTIKAMWATVSNWFKVNVLTPIQNVFKTALTAVAGFFNSLWESIKNGAKTAFNGVIGFVERAVNGIIRGVNKFFSIFNDAVRWAASITGDSWSGISLISEVSLPRLAQGAVIPPNKEFMAVLGDQKSGTNIETPLSTMVDAFNQALAQNGGGQKIILNLMLPDKRTVAQYAIEGGQVLQMSRGRNPFLLERG